MKICVDNVEKDVQNIKNPADKFVILMEPYVKDAKSKHETVECMFKKMLEVFKDLCDFYCIDSKTTIGEFFTDLKEFCFQFKVFIPKTIYFF